MMWNRSGRRMAMAVVGTLALAAPLGCGSTDGETGGERGGRGSRGATGAGGDGEGGHETGGGATDTGGTQGDQRGGGRGRTGERQPGAERGRGEPQEPETRIQCGGERESSARELTGLMATINRGEIELSQLARRKAESDQVRRYADQMVRDHRQAEQRTGAPSAGERGGEAAGSSPELRDRVTEIRRSLEKERGESFDRAYMQEQVALHRRGIELLNRTLASGVGDEQLRSQAQELRSTMERHVAQATQVYCAQPQFRGPRTRPQEPHQKGALQPGAPQQQGSEEQRGSERPQQRNSRQQGSQEQPGVGRQQQNPRQQGSQEQPGAERQQQNPRQQGSQEQPGAERQQQNPRQQGSQEQPGAERQQQNPRQQGAERQPQ